MKTTFSAKIIVETNNARQYYESGDKPEYSWKYLEDVIKSGKFTMEIVTDLYTTSYEPVFIIKEIEAK